MITQSLLEAYVKKDYYPIDDCLEICTKYKQYRAMAILQQRNQNFLRSIEEYLNHLNSMSISALVLEILQIIEESFHRFTKKKKS